MNRMISQDSKKTLVLGIRDYPYAVELANMLKDIEYPANKNTIINSIKSQLYKNHESFGKQTLKTIHC